MAVGNTSITQLRNVFDDIDQINRININDCYNTFNYIEKHMDEWATETVIGNDIRQDMKKANETVNQIMNETMWVIRRFNEFTTLQNVINTRGKEN